MIIDVHYHFMRLPADDTSAQYMTRGWLEDGAALGLTKPVDEVLSILRNIMDDTECNKLVKRMDEAGIDVTAICVVDDYTPTLSTESLRLMNEICAKAAKKHPSRLISLASIDPRRPDAPALLRTCLKEYKMNGLKWHPDNGFYPNSPEAYAVLKVANEFEIPLLTHCSPLPRSKAKFAHPLHLDDIAVDFPNIEIIAAHMGHFWWHDWAALAQFKSTISGDLAMWQLLAVSKTARFRQYIREILDIVGSKQILFGSDGPLFEPVVSNKKWVEIIKGLTKKGTDGIVFTQEEIDAILGGNAARIFRLK